jgi:single-strand DNA-binding protein
MNSITLVGRLTRDPESRPAGPEHTVATLRLAVDRRGQDRAVFVDIKAWDGLAATCVEHLRKGRLIGVAGRLAYEEWTTDAGDKRSRHLVQANEIEFLDSPK